MFINQDSVLLDDFKEESIFDLMLNNSDSSSLTAAVDGLVNFLSGLEK